MVVYMSKMFRASMPRIAQVGWIRELYAPVFVVLYIPQAHLISLLFTMLWCVPCTNAFVWLCTIVLSFQWYVPYEHAPFTLCWASLTAL